MNLVLYASYRYTVLGFEPKTLEPESPPKTTRPGLPPQYELLMNDYFYAPLNSNEPFGPFEYFVILLHGILILSTQMLLLLLLLN